MDESKRTERKGGCTQIVPVIENNEIVDYEVEDIDRCDMDCYGECQHHGRRFACEMIPEYGFAPREGTFVGGLADETVFSSLFEAQQRCLELGDECGGVVWKGDKTDGTYTVHKGQG